MGALAHALRQCEDLGLDAAAVLPAALAERETDTADCLVHVLHYRVDRRRQAADQRRSLADDTPIAGLFPRARRSGDGPLDGYLAELETAIAGRVSTLGQAAAEQLPGWTVPFGPVPTDALSRLAWTTAAGMVAGYREAYGVDDELDPLGAEPPAGTTRHAAWNSASGALELLAEAATTPADATDGADALAAWDTKATRRAEPGANPQPRRPARLEDEWERQVDQQRDLGWEWER